VDCTAIVISLGGFQLYWLIADRTKALSITGLLPLRSQNSVKIKSLVALQRMSVPGDMTLKGGHLAYQAPKIAQ